ncbi:MAG: hypothetical protein ACI87A_003627 [Planctomycetota bacterium]
MNIDWDDPANAIFALLLCGYVLANFLFQTKSLVRRKQDSFGVLAVHALVVGVVQGLAVQALG